MSDSLYWPVRWFCPVCERIFRKVQVRDAKGEPYHSYRCQTPLQPVSVALYPREDA